MDHNRVPTPDTNYFSQQAMRVGLIGSDRRESGMSSDPFREELRRELDKERIREQIIFSEIMRKRELEAEVRRELAMERELALQRGDGFPMMGEPSMWSDPRHAMLPHPRFAMLDPFDDGLPEPRFPMLDGPNRGRFGSVERPSRKMDAGSAERIPVSARAKVGSETLPFHRSPTITEAGSDELPFQRNPNAAKIIENNKLLLAGKPTPKPITANLAGTKRKTTEGANDKKPQEWTCALCKVSATCEESLKMHYQGRKHKTNQERLKKETGKNTRNSSLGKKNIGGIHKKDKKLEHQAKKKLMAPSLRKRRFAFWCEDCQIGCHSEEVMNNHIKGKKHITRMEELKETAAGSSSTLKQEDGVKQEDGSEVIDRDAKEIVDAKIGKEEVEADGQEEATKTTDSLVNKTAKAELPETEEAKSTTEGTA